MDIFAFDKYRRYIRIFNIFILIFCIFNFEIKSDPNFMISECLFILYINLILFTLGTKIFKLIYEPPVFVLFFAFIYEFFKFPYYFGYSTPNSFVDYAELLNAKHLVADYYSASGYMLVFQIFALIILLASYLFFRKINLNIKRPEHLIKFKNENILILLIAASGLFSSIMLYKLGGGNILFLLSRRSGNDDAVKALKDNYLVSLFSNLVLVTIPLYISIKLIGKKKWRWTLLLYIPGVLLAFLISGARGFTFYSLLTVLIFVFAFKNISIAKIVPFIPALFISFAVLGLIRRSSDTSQGNLSENLEKQQDQSSHWYYELSSYQLQLRDEMVFANLKSNDLLWGQTYLNLVLFPIPREWIKDIKPQFTDAYVAEIFWGRTDIGLPLNSMTESYFNFGWGGLLIFVIWGSIMASIANYLYKKNSRFNQCLAIILFVYAQTWTTSELVYVLQFLVILYPFIRMISERKLRKVYHPTPTLQ